jgi:ABC-type sugar transport system ATPase subunit
MLEVRKISCHFGDFSLHDININVNEGEYFILSGPSGAGKTVLFEIIAGIIEPSSGKVILDGKDITHEKIQHRDIGLVFQDGAIFPHLKVKENIAFALKHRGYGDALIFSEVMDIASKLSITHLLNRKPTTLSGGELQRVAIARTLVLKPSCLLLDEPLSSLDIQLREEIRTLLRNLNREGLTILHITHEFNEAYALADRISIMDNGRIVQTGSPDQIYKYPSAPFVARFTGRKNYFSWDKIKQLLPENYLNSIPKFKYVIIPDQAIRIINPEEWKSIFTISGKVTNVYRLPDHYQLEVDCGLIIHMSVPADIGSDIIPDKYSTIFLRLLPNEFIII